MSLTEKQCQFLSEMGITLWEQRSRVNSEPLPELLPVDASNLTQSQLFQDVLCALGLSIADIEITADSITLPTLRWHFIKNKEIQIHANTLLTPTIEAISQSSVLKKQLWQQIQSND